MTFHPGDLVEDNEGDKAEVHQAYDDGSIRVVYDCTGEVSGRFTPHGFTNLSERVRELDDKRFARTLSELSSPEALHRGLGR